MAAGLTAGELPPTRGRTHGGGGEGPGGAEAFLFETFWSSRFYFCNHIEPV